MENIEAKLKEVVELVKECGGILKNVDFEKETKEKEDGSLVTKYDLLIDEKLTKYLKEIFNVPILSEEHKEQIKDTYFVIDPIDGTHNFNAGLEFFGIMVAYIEKNITQFSVVHLPLFNKTYTAIRGKGSFLNDEKICVKDGIERNRLAGFTNIGQEEALNNISKLINNKNNYKFEFRKLYCSCMPMPYIAEGKLDFNIYFGPMGLWDIMAPALILEEAGGVVEYENYDTNKFRIIAGTKSAVKIIKEIISK